ncbi:MAG: TetR/AcrR family transcriptional regulator [Cyclobacteriaceae bacterium]|nr:TetR/AcrR family transcriptional regulator [Cyclobacteriaceae bacterium]
MKTKNVIKSKALELFNEQGVMNVTLRDVATALNRSYGNITYHYKTRELLLHALYADMSAELMALSDHFKDGSQLLMKLLEAPAFTFELTCKYLFFYVDFIELQRHYSDLAEKAQASNTMRMQHYMQILLLLQEQGYLRKDLEEGTLEYIMEVSGLVRTWFFIRHNPLNLDLTSEKQEYIVFINRLIMPYLTSKGMDVYRKFKQGF